jgi:hypothetical protein
MVDPTAPGISLGHGWIELDRLGVFLNAAAEVALNVFEAAQVGIGDRPVVGAFRVTPLEEGLAANIGVVAVPVDAGVPVLVGGTGKDRRKRKRDAERRSGCQSQGSHDPLIAWMPAGNPALS